ncbi:hypothetical protein [Ammoniphilus sp. 3BR4]|uniref:hypothetical protein n=1 Tax=Ammoniphilus sp. 3BR4 TaxID=3158265 RepID=UPI0034663F80
MTQEYQNYIDKVLSHWQPKPLEGAKKMIQKYGLPQEATASRLIWYNNGPWKRTIVYRDPVPHNFPTPHIDFLEQVINYRVPVGLFDEIAMFDGSVYPDRTKGEVSAKCDKEPMNFLSLNLLNDIVTRRRDVANARMFYAQTAANFMKHNITSPYTEGLLFTPPSNTGDPDVPYFY